MNAAMRQKVKHMVHKALDKRTPEKERLSTAFKALALIEEHDMLSSPLDGLLETNNETVQAAATIFDTLANPTFVASVKKVAGGIGRRRRTYDR